MKGTPNSNRWSKFFANESIERDGTTIGANESGIRDGWVQLSPYGDFANAQGMQRVTFEDAQRIVEDFNRLSKIPQRIMGLPWYIGHPDHEAFKERYKDTRAYGRIKALEARSDGLFANVRFNDEGKKLVESEAFHGHSVNWRMRQDGSVWRPFSLKSVGFTNEPAIPVLPVLAANEHEPANNEHMQLMDWIKKLLGLAPEATDDEVKTGMEAVNERAKKYDEVAPKMAANETALAEEQAARKAAEEKMTADAAAFANEKKALEGRALMAETKASDATLKAVAAETSFANERKARIEGLVRLGVQVGKITPAEKAKWETEFANEFETTATKLEKAPVKMRTTSSINVSPEGRAQAQTRREKIAEFVNEEMKKAHYHNLPNESKYSRAFAAIQTTHPELFTAE